LPQPSGEQDGLAKTRMQSRLAGPGKADVVDHRAGGQGLRQFSFQRRQRGEGWILALAPSGSTPAALAVETIEVAQAQAGGEKVDSQRAAIAKAVHGTVDQRRPAI